jgi:hypothetical protein
VFGAGFDFPHPLMKPKSGQPTESDMDERKKEGSSRSRVSCKETHSTDEKENNFFVLE